MSLDRQLMSLSQLLWSIALWVGVLLILNILQSCSGISSFDTPWVKKIFRDTFPRFETSGNPSYHRLSSSSTSVRIQECSALTKAWSRYCRTSQLPHSSSSDNGVKRMVRLEQVDFQKKFPEVPIEFSVSRGNPESGLRTSLGLGMIKGWPGTWDAPELLAVSRSLKGLFRQTWHLLHSVSPEFESIVDPPLSDHRQPINS